MQIGIVNLQTRGMGFGQLVVSAEELSSDDIPGRSTQPKRLVAVVRGRDDKRFFSPSVALKFAEALETHASVVTALKALQKALKQEIRKAKPRSVETEDTYEIGTETFDIKLYDAEERAYEDEIDEDLCSFDARVNVEAPCGNATLFTPSEATHFAALLRKAAAHCKGDSTQKKEAKNVRRSRKAVR